MHGKNLCKQFVGSRHAWTLLGIFFVSTTSAHFTGSHEMGFLEAFHHFTDEHISVLLGIFGVIYIVFWSYKKLVSKRKN